MIDLNWIEYIINFLAIFAVMTLAILASGEPKKMLTAFYMKKVCWVILIIGVSYWFITVPYVGSYHEYSGKLDYPAVTKSIEEQNKYIREHHGRIERLEDELKETKQELKEIKEHYKWIIRAMFYGVLYFGIFQVLKKRDGTLVGNSDNKTD
jgi:hypothetical protein